jgi:hypothetical protein
MKSKDVALIVAAIVVGVIFSEVINKFVFAQSNRSQRVEVVPLISGFLPNPDSQYFNSSSIDLTQVIRIGNAQNISPFSPPPSTSN